MSRDPLSAAVARVFEEVGPLARALPGFEPRPGQREMALAVARAFEEGGRVLVEAGTGTGKTIAYLVPAILGRQRVLVSTGTKNLQEQIYFKDLPVLADALGVRFTATYMKGRANYLCLQRLDAVRDAASGSPEARTPHSEGRRRRERRSRSLQLAADTGEATPDAARPADDPLFAVILEWAATTGTGDRSELGELPDDLAIWNEVSASAETCLGNNCPHYNDCFVTRMRQRAAESDIVIVNHHLLCADAAVRQGEHGEVIPACAYAVVDEAHQLEDVATQYFGTSVSNYRVEDLCHDADQLLTPRPGGNEAAEPLETKVARARAIATVRDRARVFFTALQFRRMESPGDATVANATFGSTRSPLGDRPLPWTRRGGGGDAAGEDRVRLTASFLDPAADAGHELLGALDALEQAFYAATAAREASGDADRPADRQPGRRSADAGAVARRAGQIRDELRFLLRAADPDFVYYLETRGRGLFLRASPIEVSGIVRSELLDRFQAVVLTSATLAVGGSFEYVRGRLGAHPATELRLESEFDYSRQAIVYLPPRMPDPRSPAFSQAAAAQVVQILERTRGRAFVLFTSYAMLRAVQPVVEASLPFPVLVQGSASRSLLLQQFRNTPNAVLLATSSFWQGVDVAGEALSCVIVDKLPFASPADPVTSARMEAIVRRGGEPFWEYQVPLAILTLQQGLGRLIRHRQDRGVLSVLDPRLRTKAYGQAFLDALPPAPVTSSLDAIVRFLDA